MTKEQLNKIVDSVKTIQKITDSDINEIVNSLIGVAWDEEDAGTIKESLDSH